MCKTDSVVGLISIHVLIVSPLYFAREVLLFIKIINFNRVFRYFSRCHFILKLDTACIFQNKLTKFPHHIEVFRTTKTLAPYTSKSVANRFSVLFQIDWEGSNTWSSAMWKLQNYFIFNFVAKWEADWNIWLWIWRQFASTF